MGTLRGRRYSMVCLRGGGDFGKSKKGGPRSALSFPGTPLCFRHPVLHLTTCVVRREGVGVIKRGNHIIILLNDHSDFQL